MVRLVGRGKRVLEFGCSSGYMSRYLQDAGNRVVGIEIDADAAEDAREFCEDVLVADLDVRSLGELLPDYRCDVAVFGDVLEHVRDPWKLLDDARALLEPNGFVVISIPNIAHGNVRLSLLRGAFDYSEFGLMDNTHLRFFTLRSVRELCLRAGFRITKIERTKVPLFGETNLVPQVDARDFDVMTIDEIRRDAEHDTLQFVMRAEPIEDGDRLRGALDELFETDGKLAESVARIERLERQLDEFRDDAKRITEFELLLADQVGETHRERAIVDELRSLVAVLEADLEHERERARSASDADPGGRLAEEFAVLQAREGERDLMIAELRDEAVVRRELAERLEVDRLAMVEELAAHRARASEHEATVAALRAEAADLRAELTVSAADAGEIAGLRAEVERLRQSLDRREAAALALRDETDRATAERRAMSDALEELRNDYEAMHAANADVTEERDRLAAHLANVEAQAEANRTAAEATMRDLRAEIQADRVSEATQASIVRLDGELQAVSASHRATVDAVGAFLDAQISIVRAEMAEIDAMIQGLTRSPAWRAKRVVGRLRRALPGGRTRG